MTLMKNNLHEWLKAHTETFHPVVEYDFNKEKLLHFDLTKNNKALQEIDIADIDSFCEYINDLLKNADAKFGAGGYDELRALYSRSHLFSDANEKEEPRRLHIGFDIWGKTGTEIFTPCDGIVHSFAFNDKFGDYGATIILSHQFDDVRFFTLYGHLSVADIKELKEDNQIQRGQTFAHFGKPEENGHWPPHLHFQIIQDIGSYKGDYPGVCKQSEREKYLANCPDPDLILDMRKFISS